MRFGLGSAFRRLVLISVAFTCGALALNHPAFAESSGGTPLDHTNWQNDSCHFKLVEFFTVDAAIAVSLDSEGDDLGLSEHYDVRGNTVTISASTIYRDPSDKRSAHAHPRALQPAER